MNYAVTIGKYLDQPLLVSKFAHAVPGILTASATGVGFYNVYKSPPEEKKKTFIKNLCVLGFTVASALVATKGINPIKIFGKQLFKGFIGLINVKNVKTVKEAQNKLIEEFSRGKKHSGEVGQILEKVKSNVLSLKEIRKLYEELGSNNTGAEFLKKFIPDPQNIKAKDIFGEIGRLSLIGLIPVIGGIAGGITGDVLTEKTTKNKLIDVPNKIKEGFYQYFANIFLCNIGAAGSLTLLEKMGVRSKSYRALGMVAGIMTMGVIGGSFIANYLAKKFINPLFDKKQRHFNPTNLHDIYSERKPGALDLGLHFDDIATVAIMSGLSWIEPALPLLYSISGYRAGIGYRNGNCKHKQNQYNCRENKLAKLSGPNNTFTPFEEFIHYKIDA